MIAFSTPGAFIAAAGGENSTALGIPSASQKEVVGGGGGSDILGRDAGGGEGVADNRLALGARKGRMTGSGV